MTDGSSSQTFVPAPSRRPPRLRRGAIGWARAHLFSSPLNALLSLLVGAAALWWAADLVQWALLDAVWRAESRRQCLDASPRGACWAGVIAWSRGLVYGRYPGGEIWRVNLGFAIGIAWLAPMWLRGICSRAWMLAGFVLCYPVLAGHLFLGGARQAPGQWLVCASAVVFVVTVLHAGWSRLAGRAAPPSRAGDRHRGAGRRSRWLWVALAGAIAWPLWWLVAAHDLPQVRTNLWGGLFLTFVIAGVGIVTSLLGGVVLALARRSALPLVRTLAVAYIELLRSVPLITVLFMAITMLPLFLPEHLNPDKLLLALAAISAFAAAYMAEVVRGGLQAIPLGQYEAAASIGLGHRQTMGLVVLPQALEHMIPNIVSSFIGLLKDTTVVSIVGLYDFSSMLRVPGSTPTWIGLHIETFVLGGVVFFVLCFSISRYSRHLERQRRRDRAS